MKDLQEVTKEEWEQRRADVIKQARKLSGYGEGDMTYYYSPSQIADWKRFRLSRGAKVKYPQDHSKWTIRHFSPISCYELSKFAETPVTCLLRSPDGRHYISEHLPGFCPIHQLIPTEVA